MLDEISGVINIRTLPKAGSGARATLGSNTSELVVAGGDQKAAARFFAAAAAEVLNIAPLPIKIEIRQDGNRMYLKRDDFVVRHDPWAHSSIGGSPQVRLGPTRPKYHVASLDGHTGIVTGVAWAPKGRRVATISDDQTARIWDAQTGVCENELIGHEGAVWGVAWAPKGDSVATASFDGSVRLWDSRRGACSNVLTGHSSGVCRVAWSPDGRCIASAGGDRTARIWEAATGECKRVFAGHGDVVWGIAWSPDSQHLLTAGGDGVARVWELARGRCVHELVSRTLGMASVGGPSSWIWDAAWSPDGQRIATAGEDGSAHVLDPWTGERCVTIALDVGPISGIAWSPEGRRLATVGGDGVARVWNAQDGECIATIPQPTDCVLGVSWSLTGRQLATACGDPTANVWDLGVTRTNPNGPIRWMRKRGGGIDQRSNRDK